MDREVSRDDAADLAAEQTATGKAGDGLRGPLDRRKRYLFRLLAVVLPLVPLAVAEVGLRLAAEPAGEAVDVDPIAGLDQLRPLFVLDETSRRWFIPESRMNFFRPASFPADKPANTRRVFVLGGSTVGGRPYAPETAFSSWLRLRLQAASTGADFEVINCGGVSYASYRVAKIAEEVLRHDADALVVYTGHNEFLEDRAYAKVRDLGTLTRWANRVGSYLLTVQWLGRQFRERPRRALAAEMPSEVDARLDHAGGLDAYHRDPAWRRNVESQFKSSLRRLIELAGRKEVPVILCVPACDLADTPPFKVEVRPDLEGPLRDRFTSSWATARDPKAPESRRVAAAKRCLKLDPGHAGAHYVLGTLLYQRAPGSGVDAAAAKRHLVAARDFDVCPLRATSNIVRAVVVMGRRYELPLVDVRELLDTRSADGDAGADGVPDPVRFVDHVHPTIHGHQRISAALAAEFETLGWIQPSDATELRYEASAAAHLRGLDEIYFQRGKQRLEGLRRWAAGRAGAIGTGQRSPPSNAP